MAVGGESVRTKEGIEKLVLAGKKGKPMRLYTGEGRPVTDWDGRPLCNIVGKMLVQYNPRKREFEDVRGFPLMDRCNRLTTDPGFDPEEMQPEPPSLLDQEGRPRLVYDIFGLPLTDRKGRPLYDTFGKKLLTLNGSGEPSRDLEGRQVVEVNMPNSNSNVPLHDQDGKPLRLYDEDKRPLTDHEGRVFTNIFDRLLVEVDGEGGIYKTTYGADVCDALGRPVGHPDFNPSTPAPLCRVSPSFPELIGDVKIIFDQRGFPLTNRRGTPLLDADGNQLMKFDSKSRMLLSVDGFDLIEISLKYYNPINIRAITNQVGNPCRLFNREGKPLTNWIGEPLRHADGRILIKFDIRGAPMCDFEGHNIYDEYGFIMNDEKFKPYITSPLVTDIPRVLDDQDRSIKLYDSSGMPLTDSRGYCLVNATRYLMIRFNSSNIPLSDVNGKRLYLESGLPLVNSLENEIIGPKGKPCRLFDYNGCPLTCKQGKALQLLNGEYTLRIDKIGRIISDYKGGTIFDCKGVPLSYPLKFNPCLCPTDNPESARWRQNSTRFYDCRGYPLTTVSGEPLTNARGECLLTVDPEEGWLQDRAGNPVYDLRGQLHRSISRSSKREKVKSSKDKGGSHSSSQWISTVATREMPIYNVCQLYDCNLSPLFDSNKGVIETSDGKPLVVFDKSGKVLSDCAGKDVYDNRGIPLTSVTGFWTGPKGNPVRIFNKSKRPLTDSRGKELRDISGESLVRTDEIGRPLFDKYGNPVFDVNGKIYSDVDFNPNKQPVEKDNMTPLLDLDRIPMQIFDYKGRPVTDEKGVPLLNSDGRPLILLSESSKNITDINGNKLYDNAGIPLGCSQNEPIENINGEPYRIFNKDKGPLTDNQGVPLCFANELCMIVFDMFGRPLEDSEGDPLYDSTGNAMGNAEFQPEKEPPGKPTLLLHNGNPLRLYDIDGKPLTDARGYTLLNSDGKGIFLDSRGRPLYSPEGGNLYDQYGNEFVYNKLSKT